MLSRSDPAYRHALEYLYGRLNFERTDAITYDSAEFKLDRMRQLLERLENPHRSVPTIHIAGTKGKGSTSHFLASILTRAGYRTGCYTSPHLTTIEERFAMDGSPCDPCDFVALVDALRPVVDDLDRLAAGESASGPTFFEITTAMAMLYFQWQQAQFVVLEVGLGGRLDSTNVCDPNLCVITSISFDHMRQLGSTLESIAREKAGIIKPQVPVVTGVQAAEPLHVIQQVAGRLEAPIACLGRDFDFRYVPTRAETGQAPHMDFFYVRKGHHERAAEHVVLSALGQHQAANASLAWYACDLLEQQGFPITASARREGLATSQCPARIEVMGRDPVVLIDTAHNEASIQALVRVLQESFPQRPRTLVIAATQGKAVESMLRQLIPEFEDVICTQYVENPRALSSAELFRKAQQIAATDPSVTALHESPSPADAWRVAGQLDSAKLICATGSFFLAAEMKALMAGS